MTNLFVPYELAKNLKEKNFNEDCFMVWTSNDNLIPYAQSGNNESNVDAPLYQQVTDWFRNKHQTFIDILTDCTSYPKYSFDIAKFTGNPKDLTERKWGWKIERAPYLYRGYYEALTEAIEKALKLI